MSKPDDPKHPADLPGINVEEALNRLAGSWELFCELVVLFYEDKRNFQEDIKRLIERRDFRSASIMAHSMKGSAATISAFHLVSAAHSLELACEKKNRKNIDESIKALDSALLELNRTIELIRDGGQ